MYKNSLRLGIQLSGQADTYRAQGPGLHPQLLGLLWLEDYLNPGFREQPG
jgi:hypothetical protein